MDDDECTCPECISEDRSEDEPCTDRACPCGDIDALCPRHGHLVWIGVADVQ